MSLPASVGLVRFDRRRDPNESPVVRGRGDAGEIRASVHPASQLRLPGQGRRVLRQLKERDGPEL